MAKARVKKVEAVEEEAKVSQRHRNEIMLDADDLRVRESTDKLQLLILEVMLDIRDGK